LGVVLGSACFVAFTQGIPVFSAEVIMNARKMGWLGGETLLLQVVHRCAGHRREGAVCHPQRVLDKGAEDVDRAGEREDGHRRAPCW
jgi:hypothetical protein